MSADLGLTAAPEAEDFRALARSSPWRWTTAQLRVRWHASLPRRHQEVRAWISRSPRAVRVETLGGELVTAEVQERGTTSVVMLARSDDGGSFPERYTDVDVDVNAMSPGDGAVPGVAPGSEMSAAQAGVWDSGTSAAQAAVRGAGVSAERAADPDDAVIAWREVRGEHDESGELARLSQPRLRADGLVAARPFTAEAADDAFYENYAWVAMLDPVELADGRDPDGVDPTVRAGTSVGPVAVVDHHGRPAWEAVVSARGYYEPRCGCCALLVDRAQEEREWGPGGAHRPAGYVYGEGARVRLDVGTGICVLVEQVGGSDAGAGFEVVLEDVDAELPRALFG
ncbi:hypothetical protein [Georgenia subflava]|uniref:Uncharacterized protein n=1 Tax=Georgenia subflava TaxID=1622177 RepID=A0A6N7ETM8_9MICO|nr:hypothetical protein [Georgenia subflava]MPV38524.1 hypothetical protein [Georgenia subflava]